MIVTDICWFISHLSLFSSLVPAPLLSSEFCRAEVRGVGKVFVRRGNEASTRALISPLWPLPVPEYSPRAPVDPRAWRKAQVCLTTCATLILFRTHCSYLQETRLETADLYNDTNTPERTRARAHTTRLALKTFYFQLDWRDAVFDASSWFIRPLARPPMAPYGNRRAEWMCPARQQLLMRVRHTQSCIRRRLGERSPCVTTEASSSNSTRAFAPLHLQASLYTFSEFRNA